MKHRYDEYNDTTLWRTLAAALKELEGNRDVVVNTAPNYVVGYLCQQLVLRKVVAPTALEYDPQ